MTVTQKRLSKILILVPKYFHMIRSLGVGVGNVPTAITCMEIVSSQ